MNNSIIAFLISLLITITINDFITDKLIRNEVHHMILVVVKLMLGLATLVIVYNNGSNLVNKVGWGFIAGMVFTYPRFKKKQG